MLLFIWFLDVSGNLALNMQDSVMVRFEHAQCHGLFQDSPHLCLTTTGGQTPRNVWLVENHTWLDTSLARKDIFHPACSVFES